jgi:hypothetical protein
MKPLLIDQHFTGDFDPQFCSETCFLESIEGDVENVILLQPAITTSPQNLLKKLLMSLKEGIYLSSLCEP